MCHVLRAKCKEALELTQRASFPQQGRDTPSCD